VWPLAVLRPGIADNKEEASIMTAYAIQSYQTDSSGASLVIDIRGGGSPIADGTLLDAYTPDGGRNQFWTLVPEGTSGWSFIESQVKDPDGHTLVIDIQGGRSPVSDGTLLDVYKKKSTDYDNQLWKFVEAIPGYAGWYFIQSKLTDAAGNHVVIDIQGGAANPAPNTSLDAYRQKSTNPFNQLWQLAG
jgi:hypothetical protein